MPDSPPLSRPRLRPLRRPELAGAAALLAAGMRDNPLHVAVFGADPRRREARLARFVAPLLAYVFAHGAVSSAWDGDALIGLCGALRPGRCQPRGVRRLALAAQVMARQPPPVAWRMARWLRGWAALDPPLRHWHLGPMTVAPDRRRQGIGRSLLEMACAHAAPGEHLWLETDLAANVRLYRRLGFTVAHEVSLLGVRNWFMQRPAAAPGP